MHLKAIAPSGDLKILFGLLGDMSISFQLVPPSMGHLLTQTITYPWLMLVTYGLSVMMLKSLKLSSTISVTLILFICYFTKEAHDGNI